MTSAGHALQVIHGTYGDLDRWAYRVSRPTPEQPDPGSDLAKDNQVFPHHLVSEVIRTSLASSGEHLRMVRDSVNAKQLYPSAQFTALRGALVGAAQAVWVAAPDDGTTRQERGLTVLGEMYRQAEVLHRQGHESVRNSAAHAAFDEQSNWYAKRRAEVAALQHKPESRLNQTAYIEWAIDFVFPDPKPRRAGRDLWRQMSGDAHVLGFPMIQRSKKIDVDRHTGLSVSRADGDLSDLVEPYMLSYQLLRQGWSLFDRRCEASPGSRPAS